MNKKSVLTVVCVLLILLALVTLKDIATVPIVAANKDEAAGRWTARVLMLIGGVWGTYKLIAMSRVQPPAAAPSPSGSAPRFVTSEDASVRDAQRALGGE